MSGIIEVRSLRKVYRIGTEKVVALVGVDLAIDDEIGRASCRERV